MDALEQVRVDHALLRKKILLLESALQVGPEARFVVRELAYSLQRVLEEHICREEPLVQQLRLQAPTLHERMQAIDHAVERHLLHAANRLIVSRARASTPVIILRLSQAVEQLQAQMDKQQRVLFPLLEQWIGGKPDGFTPINETMSVNEVLHRYPNAQRVFDDLHIRRWEEGADSMDEVAWHHGMQVEEIMEQLRSAVSQTPSYWYGE